MPLRPAYGICDHLDPAFCAQCTTGRTERLCCVGGRGLRIFCVRDAAPRAVGQHALHREESRDAQGVLSGDCPHVHGQVAGQLGDKREIYL
eukprot:3921518-Prymnesium_polylepis.1